MSTGVEKSSKRGFFARNIARLILNNVQIKSRIGERMWLESRLYDTKNAYWGRGFPSYRLCTLTELRHETEGLRCCDAVYERALCSCHTEGHNHGGSSAGKGLYSETVSGDMRLHEKLWKHAQRLLQSYTCTLKTHFFRRAYSSEWRMPGLCGSEVMQRIKFPGPITQEAAVGHFTEPKSAAAS